MGSYDIFIRRPILTLMLTLSLIVFGVLGYQRLGVDQFPNMEFPIVTVSAQLEGASPEVIEQDVTDEKPEIEQLIDGHEGGHAGGRQQPYLPTSTHATMALERRHRRFGLRRRAYRQTGLKPAFSSAAARAFIHSFLRPRRRKSSWTQPASTPWPVLSGA